MLILNILRILNTRCCNTSRFADIGATKTKDNINIMYPIRVSNILTIYAVVSKQKQLCGYEKHQQIVLNFVWKVDGIFN